MIPQSDEAVPLDDPFVWLATLAAATQQISLGLAAAVLPLRHPLHVAKASISLNRLSQGRFLLGLGSGDREAEFASFGQDLQTRAHTFRQHWEIVRSALSPEAEGRAPLLALTGGFDLMTTPACRIPMLVVGTARQSLQWTAQHADGWATYHREEARQQGRIALWQTALKDRAGGSLKPFVQSLQLDLLEDPNSPSEPIALGMRTGRHALVSYLRQLHELGVNHVLINIVRGSRDALEVIDEIGCEVLPALQSV